MDKDYYNILGLKRNANEYEVSDSYRKLVLRWHPKYAKEDHQTSMHHFSEISESYEILSDPLMRAFYDKYGYEKLKQGLFINGELKGGYRFGNNPEQIFEKFSKSKNTLNECLDQKIIQKGSIFSSAFGALNYTDTSPNEDLIVDVPCSLNELYQGVAKKITYEKKILNLDGKTLTKTNEEKLLQILAGSSNNSTLIYKNQGHENISRNKSNLIFQIKQIPHSSYSRIDDNLILTVKITLAEAIACTPITIRTLDDRTLRIALNEIPNMHNIKEIIGEGMPFLNKKEKGNLFIKFHIEFPKNISEENKKELRIFLKTN